jgi:curved DNA-binding protein
VAVKFRDYYEVLGVPRTASADDIKRAYRQLARKHHPDLAPASERARAAEKFKELNEANEVLSDPDKRTRYDALGANYKGGMDYTPPPGSGGPRAGAASPGAGGGVEWEDAGDFSDFFASIFGRENGRAGGRAARSARGNVRVTIPGNDVEAELVVGLDDLLRGGKRRLTLEGGRTIEVDIPRGVRPGTVLRLAGQGEPGLNGGPAGDLFLHVRLVPHPRYRVVGDDLEMDVAIWPWQAVLGADVRVETPDGPVTLKIPSGTQTGRRLRLRGRGLPRADGTRGDLHGVVKIVVPARPSPAERAAYEALKQSTSVPADQPAEV